MQSHLILLTINDRGWAVCHFLQQHNNDWLATGEEEEVHREETGTTEVNEGEYDHNNSVHVKLRNTNKWRKKTILKVA